MGLDYETYLGPYVACKVKKVKKEETIKACPKQGCPQLKKAIYDSKCKYCPICGSPITDTLIKVEGDNVSEEDVDDALTTGRLRPVAGDAGETEHHIWIDNMRESEASESFDPTEKCGVFEVNEGDRERVMSTFIGTYAKELAILKEQYGKENVEIKYGLINMIW